MSEGQYEKIAEILFNATYSTWVMNLKMWNMEVFHDLDQPQINDYVIEISNPFVPRLHAIGKLISISEDGWDYEIERIDGVRYSWENAKFVKIADKKTLELLKD